MWGSNRYCHVKYKGYHYYFRGEPQVVVVYSVWQRHVGDSSTMSRPIYDLLLKGQSVLVKGNKGTYQVANAIKQSVFKAHIQGTSTPFVYAPACLLAAEEKTIIYETNIEFIELS